MNYLAIGSIVPLGLAGCTSGSTPRATAPLAVGAEAITSINSRLLDDPTGSEQYRSPDLDRLRPIYGDG
jgi:hypothetical protein